jgi:hypothetical protein
VQFGDLRTKASDVLELKGDDIKRHEFRTVAFGLNSSSLGAKGDGNPIMDEGVVNRSLILLTAPQDLKPVRAFESKKKGDEEPEADEEDDDKYKGLKPQTIIKRLQEVKGKEEMGKGTATQRRRLGRCPPSLTCTVQSTDSLCSHCCCWSVALEFFDINAAKAVKAPEWLNLEQKRVMQLIQRNSLTIKEGELFEAVVNWGKAEAKRQKVDPSPVRALSLRTAQSDAHRCLCSFTRSLCPLPHSLSSLTGRAAQIAGPSAGSRSFPVYGHG